MPVTVDNAEVPEEAQESKGKTHGYRPCQAEVDDHNRKHLPFRSWCPFCVAGKADNDPHYTTPDVLDPGKHHVSIDYTFMESEEREYH